MSKFIIFSTLVLAVTLSGTSIAKQNNFIGWDADGVLYADDQNASKSYGSGGSGGTGDKEHLSDTMVGDNADHNSGNSGGTDVYIQVDFALQSELDAAIDGLQGTNGTNGTNGTDGTNGTNGTSGTSGTDGTDGTNGTNGTDGTNGTNGTNGVDADVSNLVTKSEFYSYTGPTTSQITVNTGEILDNSIRIEALENLNLTNGVDGNDGAKGDKGVQGDRGEVGETGGTGDTGAAGSDGGIGLTGATGAKGDTGATGQTGQQGIQGIQGIKGDQGIQGQDGDDFDGDARLTVIENNNIVINNSIVDNSTRISGNTTSINNNNSAIVTINNTLTDHENRIAELEAELASLKAKQPTEPVNVTKLFTQENGEIVQAIYSKDTGSLVDVPRLLNFIEFSTPIYPDNAMVWKWDEELGKSILMKRTDFETTKTTGNVYQFDNQL